MKHFLSRIVFLVASVVAMAAVARAEPRTLNGHVVPPRGVPAEGTRILLWSNYETSIENRQSVPLAETRADVDGNFKIELTTETLTLEIEVVGKAMRRARFAISPAMTEAAHAIVDFRMEQGASMEALLVDGETGKPIPDALIGPIVPDLDVSREAMGRIYPFFIRGDDKGRASVDGLVPGTNYVACVSSAKHERRVINISAGASRTENFRRGGASLSGKALGNRTARPYQEAVVLLTGGPDNFDIRRSCDKEGGFIFDALPEGEYTLMALLPSGNGRPVPVRVKRDGKMENILLSINEGIAVSGFVEDVETHRPLAGATVRVGSVSAETDQAGLFHFDRVTGPWPVNSTVILAGYESATPDQGANDTSINGFTMMDVTNLTLSMRRIRMLEILPQWPDAIAEDDRRIMAEVRGPLNSDGAFRDTSRLSVAQRTEYRLRGGTGQYLLSARNASGLASDLVPFFVNENDTTITLPLIIDHGAGIHGTLAYVDGDPRPAYSVDLKLSNAPIPAPWMSLPPDTGGVFQAGALPPGTFVIDFVGSDKHVLLSRTVELKRGETTEVNEVVERGKTLAGVVIDPDGKPLPEIPVEIFGADRLKTMTKADGTFSFKDLKGDVISELRVEHHQWSNEPIRDIPLPDEHYVITLTPRGAMNVLVHAPQSVLERASVVLMQGTKRTSNIATDQWYYDEEERESLAGKSRTAFTGAPSGRYRIALNADGTWSVSHAINWDGDRSGKNTTISLGVGEKGTIIASLPTLDNAALAALDVSLVNTSLPSEAPADFPPSARASGRLTFASIPTGEYLLVISRDTGEFQSKTNITLEAGETKTVELAFDKVLSVIYGEVRRQTSDGEPIGGLTAKIVYGDIPEPAELASTKTDANGRFTFDLLQAGRPYLITFSDGRRTRSVRIAKPGDSMMTVVWPDPVKVRFVLSPDLAGKITTNSIATILVMDEQGLSSVSIPTNNLQAEYPLEPGRYFAHAGEISIGAFNIVPSERVLDITLAEQAPP
ncbi:carboxypeptidase regulatory-like domain-containing protein [Candidatus Sumerlaeota bacterium]|nr:carboxypeptidase regulatory-like domain-containing protein [Candidatus Sumerlaeota bacterium]